MSIRVEVMSTTYAALVGERRQPAVAGLRTAVMSTRRVGPARVQDTDANVLRYGGRIVLGCRTFAPKCQFDAWRTTAAVNSAAAANHTGDRLSACRRHRSRSKSLVTSSTRRRWRRCPNRRVPALSSRRGRADEPRGRHPPRENRHHSLRTNAHVPSISVRRTASRRCKDVARVRPCRGHARPPARRTNHCASSPVAGASNVAATPRAAMTTRGHVARCGELGAQVADRFSRRAPRVTTDAIATCRSAIR